MLDAGATGKGRSSCAVTDNSSNSREPQAAAVLRHREREFALMPGRYLVGRSRSCNLIIDRGVISRRHAYLQVFPNAKLVLQDLDSHNGVSVNGQGIGGMVTSLRPGDWFVIGSEMFEVDPKRELDHGDASGVVHVITDRDHVMLVDSRPETLDDTQAAHELEKTCAIAERTMAHGQHTEAERLLAAPLRDILTDALGNQTLSRRIHDKAMQCALRLADVTREAEWFDYAIDLLFAQNIVCTEAQAEHLIGVHKNVGRVDPKRLYRYLELLRRKMPTVETLRVIALLESMRTTPTEKG